MNLLRNPKAKLFAACALILLLAVLAPGHGFSPATIARLILGAGALAALAFWASRRASGPSPKFALAPRLAVAARTGLSQRCGVALVEADGRTYLVAFGDGFANIHETAAARPAPKARSGRIAKPAAKKGGAR